MTKRKISTIIGSDKGGVGKSMIAQIMTLIYDKGGFPLQVIEVDNQRKLSSVLGKDRINVSLSATPDLEEISRRPHQAEAFFNPAYIEWTKGASLTDLGANVTSSLLAWIRHCDITQLTIEDGIHIQFVACASPDEQALRSALSAVIDARNTLGACANYYIVLNEMVGYSGFEPYANSESYKEILKMAKNGELTVIDIPYCDSRLFEHGKAMNMDMVQIVHESDKIAKTAGFDMVTTRVHKRKMMEWLKQTQKNMEPLLQSPDAA